MIHKQKQKGFTLLEVLLAVGVSSFLFIGFTQMIDMWTTTMRAEQMAVHMDKIRQAAGNFLQGSSPQVLRALAGGSIVSAPEFTRHLPNPVDLDGDGYPASLDGDTNPTGRDIEVSLVELPGTPAATTHYEIYINTNGTPFPGKVALAVARAIGAEAGIVGRIYTPNETTAQSVYGTWEFDATDAANFQTETSGTPTIQSEGQAHVAVHLFRSADETIGPYLYRDNMSAFGCDDCNRMATDLDLNRSNIINVGSVETQNIDVTSSATFSSSINFEDKATFMGDLEISNVPFTVSGQMSVVGAMDITNGIDVGGNLAATNGLFENARTPSMQVGTVDVSNFNVVESQRVQVNDMAVKTAQDISVSGKVETNTLSAYEMRVNGDLFANTMAIEGDIELDGSLLLDGGDGVMTAPNVHVTDCMWIDNVQYNCP